MFPEFSCVSLECAETETGKFCVIGVAGVRGVFIPSLKMSMLES